MYVLYNVVYDRFFFYQKNENSFWSKLRVCLVSVFKQQFSVFKQYFTYFHTLFHPHIFPQKFLNNNFQFLNTCTKQTLNTWPLRQQIFSKKIIKDNKLYILSCNSSNILNQTQRINIVHFDYFENFPQLVGK